MENIALAQVRSFFEKLGIDFSDLLVKEEDGDRRIFSVSLNSWDSKIVIGPRGITLAAIEHFLSLLLERAYADRKHVIAHVEVNDYRASQDARLFAYVDACIAEVLRQGGKKALRPLSGYERKKIHAYVGEKGIEGLKTVSQDDPSGRVLYVVFEGPRDLGIDMEGAGI